MQFLVMPAHMFPQQPLIAESFVTQLATERFLLRVATDVHLQVIAPVEFLRAVRTLVLSLIRVGHLVTV